MFTGIIRHVGSVQSVSGPADARRLTVELGPLRRDARCGESIAVNGACLTISALEGESGVFDVGAETLERTTLGGLARGDRVNLEPALALGGRLDGHLVQGHVDGTATVREVRRSGQWVLRFAAGADLLAGMIPKGSIAIDGVSLTLNEVDAAGFSVALIPTTLGETTLEDRRPGDRVNIETDLLGKYVRRRLEQLGHTDSGGGLDLQKLRDAGF